MQRKKTVLVIDDEPAIHQVVRMRCRKLGHSILSACTGRAGLLIARHEKPDLVLLDINMPDMDGGEIARKLASERELCSIPVVYHTGMVSADEVEETVDGRIGNDFFISKQHKTDEFLTRLEHHMASVPAA
jgi:CheY-like chemotaxis protein